MVPMVTLAAIGKIVEATGQGIVQGFSVPPMLLLMMLLTNRKEVARARTNGRWTNLLGWSTTTVSSSALIPLGSWLVT
jgi:Mn2+/Fe2+ NRAMP family transporter